MSKDLQLLPADFNHQGESPIIGVVTSCACTPLDKYICVTASVKPCMVGLDGYRGFSEVKKQQKFEKNLWHGWRYDFFKKSG